MNEDDRIGLQNEIDILTHVDHPNIVKLYEVFEDEESYWLVMELMTGGEVSVVFIKKDFHEVLCFYRDDVLLIVYNSCSTLFSKKSTTVKRRQQRPSDPSLMQLATATLSTSYIETSSLRTCSTLQRIPHLESSRSLTLVLLDLSPQRLWPLLLVEPQAMWPLRF